MIRRSGDLSGGLQGIMVSSIFTSKKQAEKISPNLFLDIMANIWKYVGKIARNYVHPDWQFQISLKEPAGLLPNFLP